MSKPKTVYFVGIKGVALSSLAEVLYDAGWQVRGSDVDDDFITQPILNRLQVRVDDFSAEIPFETDLVIYTGAHNGSAHPQVVSAQARSIRCLTHAEALAEWFNQKEGIAVCGVGGKSTISAMIAWVLDDCGWNPSFAVGVGKIIGLDRAGKWGSGHHFIAEADEYATDPAAVKNGLPLIPRFHYLTPKLTVVTHIAFDHPDVYKDFAQTKEVFAHWIESTGAALVAHESNASIISEKIPKVSVRYYGQGDHTDAQIFNIQLHPGKSTATLAYSGNTYELLLSIPGAYNLENATGTFLACAQLGLEPKQILASLAKFQSTSRRFEYKGEVNGCALYDDYAHHPLELKAVLQAAKEWAGEKQLIVAFQPHTFSRTKALWAEFVEELKNAPNLHLLSIFASAREATDQSVTVEELAEAIGNDTVVARTVEDLAQIIRSKIDDNTIFLSLGAGDIYKVHDILRNA